MPRSPQPPPIDGALIVDKPAGKTSHDVVEAVRRIAGFRQIGHLGTLDPLATGVLVLLLGRATRLMRFYATRRKRYTCGIRFGFATDSYDADGEALGPDTAPSLDRDQLENLASHLTGRISQMPPAFSAKKIHGRPAHELARKKKPVELKAVDVEVFEFQLKEIDGPLARFTVECGSGTYIRSLAHDLGNLLGSGAHIAEIARTAVGEFTLDQASTLEDLTAAAQARRLADRIVPLDKLLSELPRATVLPIVEKRVKHGAKFNLPISQVQPGQHVVAQGAPSELNAGEWQPARLRVFNQQQRLIAIAESIVPRTYQPVLVLESTS
jgi:tRNA pseudouridine55 synthase